MTREISRAESFETVHTTFEQINFTAFDYNSVKQNLIDYIKFYFPEQFNDFIESSELIAIVELFAYITELLAYRIDINTHENFILTAQRKQSVLRLAKYLSYNPSRNIPARGLTKISSISTSESVFDSRGINLSNTIINWNDQNNINWKEQFLLVLNRVLQQDFGTVAPSDRVQVDDVLFELYQLNNNEFQNGTIPFNVNVSGSSFPMELVPVALNNFGPLERRPSNGSRFSILYGSDGLGDSSSTTGFFCFTKQGTIQSSTHQYDGITPNLTTDLEIDDINETDIWINQINPDTRETITTQVTDFLNRDLGIIGEWEPVDIANAQNIIFNTNVHRNKYEVETLENDNVRIIYGDGEFADIPSGTFEIWARQSANEDLVIPQNSVINKTGSFTYSDSNFANQTFTFTFSLVNSLTNASKSEDIEQVRRLASAVYYTQDRMVNGRDYNVFPLQDPTILKLQTVNRTFAGDSKYITWHDPSNRYEDVKMFGDDMIFFIRTDETPKVGDPSTQTPFEFVIDVVEPLLVEVGLTTFHITNDLEAPSRQFSDSERTTLVQRITDAEDSVGPLYPIYIEYYNPGGGWEWRIWDSSQSAAIDYPIRADVSIVIEQPSTIWNAFFKNTKMITESPTTRFWFQNEGATVTLNTLNSNFDRITLLQANVNRDRTGVLAAPIPLNIIGSELDGFLPESGLPNVTQLNVITADDDQDGIPDDIKLNDFFDQNYNYTTTGVGELVTLPFDYIKGYGELEVIETSSGNIVSYVEEAAPAIGEESNTITITSFVGDIIIKLKDFIYYQRTSTATRYEYITTTLDSKRNWYQEGNTVDNTLKILHQRYRGRDNLNFSWFHSTPRFNLIDPATSNIHDMFIISQGYYTEFKSYLRGEITKPALPTPLQLRTDYQYLLNSKMLSDSVILHPGQFKLVFGPLAVQELQGTIKVVKSSNSILTDNEIKTKIVEITTSFFDVQFWEFGETFYFTELAAAIHASMPSDISTIVLVPLLAENHFGDLFQVIPREDEILQPNISVSDIEIIEFLNRDNIRQSTV